MVYYGRHDKLTNKHPDMQRETRPALGPKGLIVYKSVTKRLDQIGEVRIAIDHSRHLRHAHMRKNLFPKFIPASSSWKKFRRKVRLTSIMLDSNSSVDSSPKRMMSATLSIPASIRLPGPYTCSRNEFLPAGCTGFPSTVAGNLRPCCGVRKCGHNGYNTRFQVSWLDLVGRVVRAGGKGASGAAMAAPDLEQKKKKKKKKKTTPAFFSVHVVDLHLCLACASSLQFGEWQVLAV